MRSALSFDVAPVHRLDSPHCASVWTSALKTDHAGCGVAQAVLGRTRSLSAQTNGAEFSLKQLRSVTLTARGWTIEPTEVGKHGLGFASVCVTAATFGGRENALGGRLRSGSVRLPVDDAGFTATDSFDASLTGTAATNRLSVVE